MDATGVLDTLLQLQKMRHFLVAVLTFATVDHLATMPREIQYMWSGKWSTVKALFFIARYLVYIDVTIHIHLNEAPGYDPQACSRLIWTTTVLTVVGAGAGEAIVFKRAYALAYQSRVIGIFLATYWTLIQTAMVVLASLLAHSMEFFAMAPGTPAALDHCTVKSAKSTIVAGLNVMTLVGQLVATGISFNYASANFSFSRGDLRAVIYKDGIIYFVVMTGVLTVSVVASVAAPIAWRFVAPVTSRVLYTMLAARMVLNLRCAAERGTDAETTQQSQADAFSRRIGRFPLRHAESTVGDDSLWFTATTARAPTINVSSAPAPE